MFPIVPRFFSMKVGDGASIRFWEDVWVGDTSFDKALPLLYRLVQAQKVTIESVACSHVAPISRNINFLRNLSDRESLELTSLLTLVGGFSLAAHPDKRVWNISSSGVFSCKSLFDNLIDKSSVPLFPLHMRIWKAGVPHKVKFFMWSLAHRCVMTNDQFQRRRPNHHLSPQWCVMCKRSSESADNLFLHCSVAI